MKYFCTSRKCQGDKTTKPVEKFFADKHGKCLDCGYILIQSQRDRIKTRRKPASSILRDRMYR